MARLESSRELLQHSLPPVPDAPRIVVLQPRGLRRPSWAFAAGLAVAATIFIVFLVAGPGMPGSNSDSGDFAALEARLAQLETRTTHTETTMVSRKVLDAEFGNLIRGLNASRTQDFEAILGEIQASEVRSGKRVQHSSDSIFRTMLASDPRIVEK